MSGFTTPSENMFIIRAHFRRNDKLKSCSFQKERQSQKRNDKLKNLCCLQARDSDLRRLRINHGGFPIKKEWEGLDWEAELTRTMS